MFFPLPTFPQVLSGVMLPGPRGVAAVLGEVAVAVLLEKTKLDEGTLVAAGDEGTLVAGGPDVMLASSR